MIKKAEKWAKELKLDESKIVTIKEVQSEVFKVIIEKIDSAKDQSACAACSNYLLDLSNSLKKQMGEI